MSITAKTKDQLIPRTAAARSSCPAGAAVGFAAPPGLGGAVGAGRGADGIGGFPGIFGAPPGFTPTGGAGGFGLVATGGGGLLPIVLDGLESTGVLLVGELPPLVDRFFFHGVADPFEGAMPGNTDTGLADASAPTALKAAADGVGLPDIVGAAGALGAAGAAGGGGGRRTAGGGGGGTGAAFGFGGTSSR